ncbi:MAG: serine hydrolase domain-containing protein [Anaerolineae bacterium]
MSKRWWVVFVVLLLPVMAAAQDLYVDPTGSFQFQLPTGWTVDERDGFIIVNAPNEEIITAASVEDTDDMMASIALLWAKYDPTFDTSATLQTIDVPENQLQGFEAGVTVVYADGTGADGAFIAAGSFILEGRTYPSIVITTLSALQRRFSQYLIFSQSYRATSAVEADADAGQAQPWDEAMAANLRAFMAEALEDLNVPGAAVAIVQDGRVVFAEGFGTTGEGAVNADTVFLIASLSKSMTTLAMAQAVDAGVFAWDTPVIEVLPTFAVADPNITQSITMENLVCACSGVPRRDFEIILNTFTAEEMIDSLATFEFFTDFGEAFQYSNQLVAAAGYLTALARGGTLETLNEDFAAMLEAFLFEPLGMTRSTLRVEDLDTLGNVAQPHGQSLEGLRRFDLSGEEWVASIAPSGGVWSTVNDMARYLLMAINEGELDGVRVVSADNLTHTWQSQIQINAATEYGLGWILGEFAGNSFIFHDGNALGYTSLMGFLPEQGVGVVVLANAAYSPLPNLALTRALELIYDQPDETTAALAQAAEQAGAPTMSSGQQFNEQVDTSLFEPFVGEWANDALGDLTLSIDGADVIVDFGEYASRLWELIPQAATTTTETFYVTADAPLAGQVILRFREGETPQIVLGAGAIEYTFSRR